MTLLCVLEGFLLPRLRAVFGLLNSGTNTEPLCCLGFFFLIYKQRFILVVLSIILVLLSIYKHTVKVLYALAYVPLASWSLSRWDWASGLAALSKYFTPWGWKGFASHPQLFM